MDESRKARRFFCPAPCEVGGMAILPPQRSRHAVTVLRLGEGDAVRLFTGQGEEYLARIERADPQGMEVRVLQRLPARQSLPASITLGFAPAPRSRTDILVEKAAELGADRLQPLVCARVQRGEAESAVRRRERWQRKARQAARQCQRRTVPTVAEPMSFAHFLEEAAQDVRLIGAGPGDTPVLSVLRGLAEPPGSVCLAIGPAGGFTARELRDATEAGFQIISLGPNVLRVETAALSLLSAVVAHLDAVLPKPTD